MTPKMKKNDKKPEQKKKKKKAKCARRRDTQTYPGRAKREKEVD